MQPTVRLVQNAACVSGPGMMLKGLQMRSLSIAAAGVAAALFATGAVQAAPFANGGFESPVLTGGYYQQFDAPSTAITGWTVTAGSVDIVTNAYAPADEGVQFLDLVGSGSVGALSQTFDTIVGQTYQLSFAYSHNFSANTSAQGSVSVGDLIGLFSHDTGSTSAPDWRTFTSTFTALGPTSTLLFTNTQGGNNGGVLLDSVAIRQVAAAPEPSTWAMMILGVGLAGAALRRRREAAGALGF